MTPKKERKPKRTSEKERKEKRTRSSLSSSSKSSVEDPTVKQDSDRSSLDPLFASREKSFKFVINLFGLLLGHPVAAAAAAAADVDAETLSFGTLLAPEMINKTDLKRFQD